MEPPALLMLGCKVFSMNQGIFCDQDCFLFLSDLLEYDKHIFHLSKKYLGQILLFSWPSVMDCAQVQVQSSIWRYASYRWVEFRFWSIFFDPTIVTEISLQGETEDNHDLTRGIVWDKVVTENVEEVDDKKETCKLQGALIVAFTVAILLGAGYCAWHKSKRVYCYKWQTQ